MKRKKHTILGIIPARLKSTRFAEKLIQNINGKPLLYYTWKQALKVKSFDKVYIATDSKIIFDQMKNYGANVLMTSDKCNSGSDRVYEAAKKLKCKDSDIVVNIQGDEPLINPQSIENCLREFKDKNVLVSTSGTKNLTEEMLKSPNFVKVICDKNSDAIYFSRSVIPFPRENFTDFTKHLGLYAYKFSILKKYVKWKVGKYEEVEKLEQLRFLENGIKIRVAIGNWQNMEVNTKDEFDYVKEFIENKKNAKL